MVSVNDTENVKLEKVEGVCELIMLSIRKDKGNSTAKVYVFKRSYVPRNFTSCACYVIGEIS